MPLADYASKEMKLKAAITAGDDFAFGYEQVGGFQSVFEDSGGKLVKKLWSPFNTPDYMPYLAQIDPKEADVVVLVYAGANPLKFIGNIAIKGSLCRCSVDRPWPMTASYATLAMRRSGS